MRMKYAVVSAIVEEIKAPKFFLQLSLYMHVTLKGSCDSPSASLRV